MSAGVNKDRDLREEKMERLDPESIAFKKIFEDVKIEEGAEYYSQVNQKHF